MVMPIAGGHITTPYGKRGSSWSCRRDSHGNGIHTGADIAAAVGTPVLAMRPGVARHVDYGPAFGRHQLAVRCADGTEDFYAHMRWRIADRANVSAGQKIGEVGVEGNSTGGHIHFERHRSQGHWNCDVVVDPRPSWEWQSPAAGDIWQQGKVFASKMHAGQEDSDSVRNLQSRLNDRVKAGLPVTGFYGPGTIEACRRFQESQGWRGDDANGIAGPQTVRALGLTWVDDL